ncbi:MAG TPA: TetR/AcrR family transcriptional regulator [Anaerolineales bacterium]|nr:TetR/AcrR family transcriptional regulator [Anaerolineales bacterium]
MPLTQRPSRKRTLILQTAQRLFRDRGFAQTSMDLVTAEAGVSKQTVYAHFSSKDTLFVEVLRAFLEDGLAGPWPSIAKDATPAGLERQLCALGARLSTALMDPGYLATVRMAIAEMPRMPQLGELFSQAVPYRVLTLTAGLFKDAAARGLVAVADPTLAARLFIGPFVVTTLIEGLLKPSAKPRRLSKRQIAQIVRMVLGGIQTSARA